MKGKKVLKIFLVTMVVVTMLAQVAAFAAGGPTYTTDTTYYVDSEGVAKAQVTSTIYGVGRGEEVTFLVEDANDNILYIDQINEADYTTTGSESASFTYLVPLAAVNADANVRFATTSNAASAVTPVIKGTDDTIILDDYKVSYTVTGEGFVFVDASDDETAYDESASTVEAYKKQTLTFYVAPATGYEFAGYKVGDSAEYVGAGLKWFKYEVTADATMDIKFTEKSIVSENPTAVSVTTNTETDRTVVDGAMEGREVAVFAALSGDNIVEYGVLVSKNKDDIYNVSNSALSWSFDQLEGIKNLDSDSVKKFAAYGSYDGRYGVKLVNGTSTYLDGTVYLRPYAKTATEYTICDTIYEVSFDGVYDGE